MKYEVVFKGNSQGQKLANTMNDIHKKTKKLNSSFEGTRKKIESAFGVEGVMGKFRNGMDKTKKVFNNVKEGASVLGKGLASAGRSGIAGFQAIKAGGGSMSVLTFWMI